MQIPLVMMLALSGLGCQNGASDVIDTPPLPGHQIDAQPFNNSQGTWGAATTYSGSLAPSPYPEIGTRVYDRYSWHEPTDWHTGLRHTLYSFVWGRDPNVSTVRNRGVSLRLSDRPLVFKPTLSTSGRTECDRPTLATNCPVWFFPLFSLFEIEIGV